MWEFYRYIRPFKKGAAQFAYMTKMPILPMAFSYRRPGFIRRKIFKQEALFTLNIGELILPDFSDTTPDAKNNLTKKCHETVCNLAGIKDNIYDPIFNNSKRIHYE
jgi:1-acyl-sn-glycerol-3-phosphate acyltransferase